MISARVAAFVLAASHFARSWLGTDIPRSLVVEIAEFRAEINRAEVSLRHTTAILDHCTNYTSFLTFVLKLVALSELLLCCWIIYLLTFRNNRFNRPGDCASLGAHPDLVGDSRPLEPEPAEVSPVVRRSRPTRPSDLKKLGQ